MPTSRGTSRPRDRTHVSYVSGTGRQVLYHEHHLGSPIFELYLTSLFRTAVWELGNWKLPSKEQLWVRDTGR